MHFFFKAPGKRAQDGEGFVKPKCAPAAIFGVSAALTAAIFLSACSDASYVADVAEEPAPASAMRARLMTGAQYTNALANMFGEDVAGSVVSPMPPMPRTDGLLVSGASLVGMTSDQLSQVQIAASTVAAKVVDEDHRDYLIPCEPADANAADRDCAAQFLSAASRLWFRRPLPQERLDVFIEVASDAADELEDFYAGLELSLEGMLVSPQALYIIDRVQPDPDGGGVRELDGYSLASRLSFFLWNSPPDAMLLDAAESGEILTPEGRARIVDAMLESPRLETGVRAFFDDMLGFDEFDTLAKDSMEYPAITGATLADAREQTLRTIYDQLIEKNGDYRDLFVTRDTFMSPNLAVAYDVPTEGGWQPYTFPEGSPRQGLLTQISFLAAHAHPARSSITLRGRALRQTFLCQIVPDPPANVDFSALEDPDPSLRTARQRIEAHAVNPSCAGCHKIMDPIGVALEHFDGSGKYRETEDGAEIDATGGLDGFEFTDVRGLSAALRDHPAVPACLVERAYAYGTGGALEGRRDWPVLNHLEEAFAESGYRLPDLMRTIALSQAFAEVRAPEQAEDGPASVASATGQAAAPHGAGG